MIKRLLAVLLILALLAGIFIGLMVLLQHGQTLYLDLMYPLKYEDTIQMTSEEFGITPSLIAAVICVESRFDARAVSSAGAIGLMQITPETFDWLQNRLDVESPLADTALSDPTVNIRYGTYDLLLMHEMFEDGDTALAAYNAGQGTVREWLSDSRYSDDGVHLKEIPYEETAQYVKRVRKAQTMYRERYGLE